MSVHIRLACVTALTLLGFALRFYQLNEVPLRGDEAFTVIHWMREPLADTLANITTVDPQAPLSYALYRGWGLVMGTSEGVARILPALLNVIGIPLMYALGCRLRGWRLGLLAALLWAIHPYQIWHAQDARNYAIWAMLSPATIWLALRALERQRRVDGVLYVAAAALGGYIYYLHLFIIAAVNLYALLVYWRQRATLLRWIGLQIVVGILLAPWYLQERLLSGGGYAGTAGGFDATQWFTRFLPSLTFGDTDTFPLTFVSVAVPLLVLALAAGLAVWWRRDRRGAMLAGLVGILPLLLIGLVATRLGVFTPRYVIGAAPAYTLILSVLVLALKPKWLKAVGFSVVVLISLYGLNQYFLSDYAKSPAWRTLARFLAANVHPGEWVTQAAADEAFTFYCNDYEVPANCDDKLPASPDQSLEEITALLTMRSEEADAIWYVANPQPWDNADIARDWLTANMQQVRDTSADGLSVQAFKQWDVPNAEIDDTPLATFDKAAQLVGIETFIEPTDELTIWLYWQALETTDTPLKVFLHLRDGASIAAQDDQFPQDGRISTAEWAPGTVYRDIYSLSLDGFAPGDYALVVGFYEPETNRRLPVGDGDSYTIETVTIP